MKKDRYLEPWKSSEFYRAPLETKKEKKEAMKRMKVYKKSFEVEVFESYLTSEGPEVRGPRTLARHGYEIRILDDVGFVYYRGKKPEGGYCQACCKNYYRLCYPLDLSFVCEQRARRDYEEAVNWLAEDYWHFYDKYSEDGERLIAMTIKLTDRQGVGQDIARRVLLKASYSEWDGLLGDLDAWESDPDPED